MKVVSHTRVIDEVTFAQNHLITIAITEDVLCELRHFAGGGYHIDFLREHKEAFGEEFWIQVVLKLIEGKELV